MTRLATLFAGALAVATVLSVPAVQAQDLDLDAVFGCTASGPVAGETPEQCQASRDIVLNNCTSCHSFVPIVKAQKAPDAWDATLGVHRTRVPQLSDEQYDALREFLKGHFNDQLPPPALPPELDALGVNLPA